VVSLRGNTTPITKYYTVKKEENIPHTIKRRKANWIFCHILVLRRNCLVKHAIEETIKGRGKPGR